MLWFVNVAVRQMERDFPSFDRNFRLECESANPDDAHRQFIAMWYSKDIVDKELLQLKKYISNLSEQQRESKLHDARVYGTLNYQRKYVIVRVCADTSGGAYRNYRHKNAVNFPAGEFEII